MLIENALYYLEHHNKNLTKGQEEAIASIREYREGKYGFADLYKIVQKQGLGGAVSYLEWNGAEVYSKETLITLINAIYGTLEDEDGMPLTKESFEGSLCRQMGLLLVDFDGKEQRNMNTENTIKKSEILATFAEWKKYAFADVQDDKTIEQGNKLGEALWGMVYPLMNEEQQKRFEDEWYGTCDPGELLKIIKEALNLYGEGPTKAYEDLTLEQKADFIAECLNLGWVNYSDHCEKLPDGRYEYYSADTDKTIISTAKELVRDCEASGKDELLELWDGRN